MLSKVPKQTLIVGGGPMGLSTALHLLLQGRSPSTITVAERDPTLRLNSASLSAGGLRTQFSLPENIKLSQYMLKLLSDDAKPLTQLLATVCEKHGAEPPSQDDVNQSVNFLPGGYLFLACSAAGATSLRDNSGIQPNTEYIASQAAIETKFPYLTTADLTAAAHTPRDGWLDPYGLLSLLRRVLKSCDVTFLNATVTLNEFNSATRRVESVHVTDDMGTTVRAVDTIVNCAGANANVLLPEEHQLPVAARCRTIFHFANSSLVNGGKGEVGGTVPLTVDPGTGVWFRGVASLREGSNDFLCGSSPLEGDQDPDDERVRDIGKCTGGIDPMYSQFEDVVWPALYNRVEDFGDLKVKNQWAGWYDYNTADQNGIVGYHGGVENMVLGNGWSGHGMQMGLGVGRHLAEVIEGADCSVDLNRFRVQRFEEGEEIFEEGIV